MARSDAVRLGLTMRQHESAKGVVAGLLNGALMGYPRERLAQLIDATRAALGDARLHEVWDDAFLRLESLVESGAVIDEAQLIRLLQSAGMDAGAVTELIADNAYSPDAAPDRAREYAYLVWAGRVRSLASRIYSAAGEANLDELTKLLDELPALVEQGGRSGGDELRPHTPAALLASTPLELDWLWYGIVPAQGFTLLAAREKAGKSTLLFGLLGAMARGSAFLGRQTKPTRVLYLSEESAATVVDKLRRFGVDNSDGVYFLTRDDFEGGTIGALHRCRRAIERVVRDYRIQYVCIDTLQGFARIAGDSENQSGAMLSEILLPVQLLLRLGVGVLVVHHMSKHGHEPRGSTALGGMPDMIMRMRRVANDDPSDTRRELNWTGRLGDGNLVFAYDRVTGEYTALGERDEAQYRDTVQAIRRYLESAGEPQTLDSICQAIGGNRQRIAETLTRLYHANALHRTGSGRRGDPYLYTLLNENEGLEIDSSLRTTSLESISNDQRVREWLVRHAAGTPVQAADALGISRRRAAQLLNQLVEQGFASREGSEATGYTYRWSGGLEIDSSNAVLKLEPISNAVPQPSDLLYPDDASVSRAFEQWLAHMRGDGLLQLDADDERLVRAVFERAQAAGWPALQVRLRNGGWRNLDATRWSWLHAIQTLALDGASLEDLLNALDAAGSTHRASHTHTESIPLAGKGDDAIAPPPALT